MGSSPKGILAYGVDIGGGEEWKIAGVDEYGSLPEGHWLDADDCVSAIETKLLAEIAGFTEVWASGNDGHFDRKRAAEAAVGVEVVWCGSTRAFKGCLQADGDPGIQGNGRNPECRRPGRKTT